MSIEPDLMHADAMGSMCFLLLHQVFFYAKDPNHMSIVPVIWPQIVCYCFSLKPRVIQFTIYDLRFTIYDLVNLIEH